MSRQDCSLYFFYNWSLVFFLISDIFLMSHVVPLHYWSTKVNHDHEWMIIELITRCLLLKKVSLRRRHYFFLNILSCKFLTFYAAAWNIRIRFFLFCSIRFEIWMFIETVLIQAHRIFGFLNLTRNIFLWCRLKKHNCPLRISAAYAILALLIRSCLLAFFLRFLLANLGHCGMKSKWLLFVYWCSHNFGIRIASIIWHFMFVDEVLKFRLRYWELILILHL